MLHVCPTPIGNLGDITLRVLETLREADLIAAEDTRHTRKLLSHYGISKPMVSFHEHNEIKRLPELLQKLRDGKDIALVSDAGMPGICDPGYRVIRAALAEGLPLEVLPGPSALETALVASGFATDSFVFLGFLPRKKNELDQTLRYIAGEIRTCVAYESPHRVARTLSAAVAALAEKNIAVCRELTKKFEEITRGSASSLAANLPEKVKGEIVMVFEGSASAEKEPEEMGSVKAALEELMASGTPSRQSAKIISLATGMPQNRVYKLVLELKQNR